MVRRQRDNDTARSTRDEECGMTRKEQIISAFERGYRVLDDGRVLAPSGTERRLRRNTNGYLEFTVAFRADGKRISRGVTVHQLMAYQKFGGKMFSPGIMVRHADGSSTNNCRENILIGTQSQNQMDIPPARRTAYATNAAQKLRRLSDTEEGVLRAERNAGATYKALCAKWGLAKSTVSYIVHKPERFSKAVNE